MHDAFDSVGEDKSWERFLVDMRACVGCLGDGFDRGVPINNWMRDAFGMQPCKKRREILFSLRYDA